MQFQKLKLAVFPPFAQCVWVIVSPTWTFFLTWSLFHNYYTIRQDVWEGWWWRGWKGGMKEDTSFLPLNNIYPIPFFSLHTTISHILFYPIEFKFVYKLFQITTRCNVARHSSGVLFKRVVNLSGQIVQDGPKTKIFLLQASGWNSDILKSTKYE